MLGDTSGAERIYNVCGYTDMRKSIDGLSSLVKKSFGLDPFDRSLYLFCGRRCDRIKAIYWEDTGFVLLYKWLEQSNFQPGGRFPFY